MRANEFVANKIYQESKLFEDELSDFFQIEEIRVEGEKKFRLKFGPDDTEGELFDTRRDAQQAKREQIKLARQAGDFPKDFKSLKGRIKQAVGFLNKFGWLTFIFAVIDGIVETSEIVQYSRLYHRKLKELNVCDLDYNIQNLSIEKQNQLKPYISKISEEITNGIISVLTTILASLTAFYAATVWIRPVLIGLGVGGLILNIIIYGSVSGAMYALHRVTNHPRFYSAVNGRMYNALRPTLASEWWVKKACNDDFVNLGARQIQESTQIDSSIDSSMEGILKEIESDPKIQEYAREAEQNKQKGLPRFHWAKRNATP